MRFEDQKMGELALVLAIVVTLVAMISVVVTEIEKNK